MDIQLKTENGIFKYRVSAIIIHDGKLLAVHDDISPYYYPMGGKVKLHETAEDAILREIKEELGVDAEIIRPLWICQNLFTEDVTKERFHELCFFFLIDITKTDLLSRGNKFVMSEGERTNTFEWLQISELEKMYFHPDFIKTEIQKLPKSLKLLTVH